MRKARRLKCERLEDRAVPAIMDYSSFFGGNSSDPAFAVAADADGNTYVTGMTGSTTFPHTAGAFDESLGGILDAYVAKFHPDGTLAWATYLGGSGDERGHGIAVDSAGNIFVTGRTNSADFPTTAGSFDTTFNGNVDAFVAKLNADGSALAYSTFLGGSEFEIDQGFDAMARQIGGIAVDAAGNAYVTGETTSADFPTTAGAFRTTLQGLIDAYVTKLNPSGSAIVYSTFLGGTDIDRGHDIEVDAGGNAYVTGEAVSGDFPTTAGAVQPGKAGGFSDTFITKLNPQGTGLVYSSYLGGTGSEFPGRLALDTAGQAYLTGSTASFDFPTTAGAFQPVKATNGSDAYITKVNASGTSLVYSTHLGGTFGNESGSDIDVDGSGQAYVTGSTESGAFPLAGNFQPRGGMTDAFVSALNAAGSALVYSSYLGGGRNESGFGIAIDGVRTAHVVGQTNSSGEFQLSPFPTTAQAFQPAYEGGGTDAFVVRVSNGAQAPNVSSVVVNDGGSQRSRVTSLTLTFDRVVQFTGDPANAVVLARDGTGASVTFTATVSTFNNLTTVTLSNFTGSETQFGSLRDGRYTLTVRSNQVSTAGQQMAGDFIFGEAQGLYRFFGDVNGDRRVDIRDYGLLSVAYLQQGNYNSALDFNGDGRIDIADLGQFAVRYLTTLP